MNKQALKRTQFILASASLRRKQLLTEAGYIFSIHPADIEESQFLDKDLRPLQFAETVALEKAKKIANQFPDNLILGADTVVDYNGEIIGKAEDEKDAVRITRKLFSSPHKVITGIALVRLSDQTEIIASDVTVVYPKRMTDRQLQEHIESKSWHGKAGAYAIQENGDQFVEKIEGSLTNVIGLPMELLQKLLKELNVIVAK